MADAKLISNPAQKREEPLQYTRANLKPIVPTIAVTPFENVRNQFDPKTMSPTQIIDRVTDFYHYDWRFVTSHSWDFKNERWLDASDKNVDFHTQMKDILSLGNNEALFFNACFSGGTYVAMRALLFKKLYGGDWQNYLIDARNLIGPLTLDEVKAIGKGAKLTPGQVKAIKDYKCKNGCANFWRSDLLSTKELVEQFETSYLKNKKISRGKLAGTYFGKVKNEALANKGRNKITEMQTAAYETFSFKKIDPSFVVNTALGVFTPEQLVNFLAYDNAPIPECFKKGDVPHYTENTETSPEFTLSELPEPKPRPRLGPGLSWDFTPVPVIPLPGIKLAPSLRVHSDNAAIGSTKTSRIEPATGALSNIIVNPDSPYAVQPDMVINGQDVTAASVLREAKKSGDFESLTQFFTIKANGQHPTAEDLKELFLGGEIRARTMGGSFGLDFPFHIDPGRKHLLGISQAGIRVSGGVGMTKVALVQDTGNAQEFMREYFYSLGIGAFTVHRIPGNMALEFYAGLSKRDQLAAVHITKAPTVLHQEQRDKATADLISPTVILADVSGGVDYSPLEGSQIYLGASRTNPIGMSIADRRIRTIYTAEISQSIPRTPFDVSTSASTSLGRGHKPGFEDLTAALGIKLGDKWTMHLGAASSDRWQTASPMISFTKTLPPIGETDADRKQEAEEKRRKKGNE